MGGGSYSYDRAVKTAYLNSSKSRQEIFKSRKLFEEMNIKGKVRECCETTEHPDTLPIIIGLDVTGSMGYIPEVLIKNQLPKIVKAIKEAGVEHPEICFCAVGDDVYDEAPIQVGQFESSDELIEKWLTHTWIEGGGGGNNGESYCLVHYFAAYHTKCDAFKRGKKGILITIGDERYLTQSSKHTIEFLFGDKQQVDVDFDKVYEECAKNWNIFHINVADHTAERQHASDQWTQLLGADNVKNINKTGEMEELIPALVSCITSDVSHNVITSNNSVETVTML